MICSGTFNYRTVFHGIFSPTLILLFSGIKFYTEVGFLALGLEGEDNIERVKYRPHTLQEKAAILDRHTLRKQFPFLFLYDTQVGIYTPERSGHISARRMVKAQTEAARMAGCDIIDDVIQRIISVGSHEYQIEAEKTKAIFRARKILLATGAFTHNRDLLPKQYHSMHLSS